MDPLTKRRIGKTNLYVTILGLGCSLLGNAESDEQATETCRTAFAQGVNYVDVAPLYCRGLCEVRLGHALKEKRRKEVIISTKVGRVVKSDYGNMSIAVGYDYSKKGILESYQGSLSRLGVQNVDILFIHDPDNHYEQAINEAYHELDKLRSSGDVQAIGAGMNQWEMELRFAKEGNFDCFLLAGPYTLLEQEALKEFLPYCVEQKMSVIIGGPYSGGILASRKGEGTYNEGGIPKKGEQVPKTIAERAAHLIDVCAEFNVPIKAASLQFVLAHPAVVSVIPGTRSPEHQEENFRMLKHSIPHEFWDILKERDLIEEEAPTPH